MSEFSYRDKPDMSYIWLKHMDRTNLSSGNIDGLYDSYVQQQFRLLPLEERNWVMSQKDAYISKQTQLVYKHNGSNRIGFEDNPMVWNSDHTELGLSSEPGFHVKRDEDGDIDWSDDNIFSPTLEEYEDIDYKAFNLYIMDAAERSGLSWKTEPTNSEYGLYPEKEELDLGHATPLSLEDSKKKENLAQNPLYQMCKIDYKGETKLVTNFRGYAVGIDPGEKPWFFTAIAHKQKKQKPVVILITAPQGEGKTYAGIRLAEIFDKEFDPHLQIAMARNKILYLVSGKAKLKRNQVIIVDESQWGASAREWGKPDQIKLMKFFAAARFKGYIIIIVALHRKMLDAIIRERILTFHIHMEDRGEATIYETIYQRFDETNYPARKGKLVLQLPDYDTCDFTSCLECKHLIDETCYTNRAIYERDKTAFVESEAEKEAVAELRSIASEMSERELAELCLDHLDKLEVNAKGFYELVDIKDVLLDEYELDISDRKAKKVRVYLRRIAPPTIT